MSFLEKWFPMGGLEEAKLPEQNDKQKLVSLLKKWSDILPVESGSQGENRDGIENRLQNEVKTNSDSFLDEIITLSAGLSSDELIELYTQAGLNDYEKGVLAHQIYAMKSKTMTG